MGDRVVKGGKGSTSDAGTHVPFIVSWPGTVKPGVSQALVDFSDVLPTLCEVAGAEVPDELPIDGRSFLPVLRGEKESVREWTYCWYARDGGKAGSEFARDRRFKLYRDDRFYDVAADPLEETNLLAAGELSAEAVAARDALQKVLDRYENTRRIPDAPGEPKAKKKRNRAARSEGGASARR
jgi:arylsulfatase A